MFWNPTPEVKTARLKRYTVPIDLQGDFESERSVYCATFSCQGSDFANPTPQRPSAITVFQDTATYRVTTPMAVVHVSSNFIATLLDKQSFFGDLTYLFSDKYPQSHKVKNIWEINHR